MGDPAEEAKRLFVHNTVKDSLDYLYSLSRTIDESSRGLRSLIGDSEKDLLAACERISDMRASSATILAVQERLHRYQTPTAALSLSPPDASPRVAKTGRDGDASTAHGSTGEGHSIHQHIALLASTGRAAESALSVFHEAEVVVRTQLVNMEALLLARRPVAACGALKEAQTLLTALRKIPADVRDTLTTASVVAAAADVIPCHTSPSSAGHATATTTSSSWTFASAANTGASQPKARLSTKTDGETGADEGDAVSEESSPAADIDRLRMRREALLEMCTRAQSAFTVLDTRATQYEVELLRTIQTSLRQSASAAAIETLEFLYAESAMGGQHSTGAADEGSKAVRTRANVEAERAIRYHRRQQRRQTALARRIGALFAALEGVTWSDATIRWLASAVASPTASGAADAAPRAERGGSSSPVRAVSLFQSPPTRAAPSAESTPQVVNSTAAASDGTADAASDAIATLASLRATAATSAASPTTPSARARDDAGVPSYDNPRLLILQLVESAVIEAASACLQWGLHQETHGRSDAWVDSIASSATATSPDSCVSKWIHTHRAQRQLLVDMLRLPTGLAHALMADDENGDDDKSHSNNHTDAATHHNARASTAASDSLAAVALFLVSQAKFMYASLCKSTAAFSSTLTSTAAAAESGASAMGRTRPTNTALLLSVEEEENAEDAFSEEDARDIDAWTIAPLPPSPHVPSSSLSSMKRKLWTRLADAARRGHTTSSSMTPAVHGKPGASSQSIIAALLEAKNVLLYAAAPSSRDRHAPSATLRERTSEAQRDADSTTGSTPADEGRVNDVAYDDDDDDDAEENSAVVLPLVGARAQAERRKQYVAFLLHATAATSACELVRYRATWASAATRMSDIDEREGSAVMDATTRTRASAALSALSMAASPYDESAVSPAHRQELLVRDRERLQRSQDELLLPYLSAVIALLGEGQPLLWAAYLVHEVITPSSENESEATRHATRATTTSAPTALFNADAWRTTITAVLAATLENALANAFTCLLNMQTLATDHLLSSASRATQRAESARANPTTPKGSASSPSPQHTSSGLTGERTTPTAWGLLPQCTRLVEALTQVAAWSDSNGHALAETDGAQVTTPGASRVGARPSSGNGCPASAPQLLADAIAHILGEVAATDGATSLRRDALDTSSAARPLLARLGMYHADGRQSGARTTSASSRAARASKASALHVAHTTQRSDHPWCSMDAMTPSSRLYTTKGARLSAILARKDCATGTVDATRHASVPPPTDAQGASPAPAVPSDANTEGVVPAATVDAHGLARAQSVVLAFLFGLLAPTPAATHTEDGSVYLPAPHDVRRTWLAALRDCLALPGRLAAWLRQSSSLSSSSSSSSAASTSLESAHRVVSTLLARLAAQQKAWLLSAMRELRMVAQAEIAAVKSSEGDAVSRVRSAARAFELSGVAWVLCEAAACLAQTTSAVFSSSSSSASSSSPCTSLIGEYRSCQTEAQQLFRTMNDPWRALVRLEVREALTETYVKTSLSDFVRAFAVWAPSDPSAAHTPTTVWSEGYRTAKGQHWSRQTSSSPDNAVDYPFLPSTSVERVSWHVEQLLQQLRALAPSTARVSDRTTSSAYASSNPIDDVLVRVKQEVAEAMAAVVDGAVLPGMRTLPDTIAADQTRHHHTPGDTETNKTALDAPPARIRAPLSAMPRAELERVVKSMTSDFWLQLYMDIAVWRLLWLPSARPSGPASSGASTVPATSLADRFDALLRHCTLHGDAARWRLARPLIDAAVPAWLHTCGLLHGQPPANTSTPSASPPPLSTSPAPLDDKLGQLRKVDRFSLLPISSSASLMASAPRGGGGSVVGLSLPAPHVSTLSAGGAGAFARAGARRLAPTEGSLYSSGTTDSGRHTQRFYAPPPPSQSTASFQTGAAAERGGDAPRRHSPQGRVGLSSVQDGVAGAAALWDQTQRGWSTFWSGGSGQPHARSNDQSSSSRQTL